jgi:hypothetical protein
MTSAELARCSRASGVPQQRLRMFVDELGDLDAVELRRVGEFLFIGASMSLSGTVG